MNIINIVQTENVYKYFTSTSTFFQSSCEIMHIAKITITALHPGQASVDAERRNPDKYIGI